jgi:hypothetical protein
MPRARRNTSAEEEKNLMNEIASRPDAAIPAQRVDSGESGSGCTGVIKMAPAAMVVCPATQGRRGRSALFGRESERRLTTYFRWLGKHRVIAS